MRTIRIGSRGSKLALWQTNMVAEKLRQQHIGLQIEIEIIKTKGDKILDVALSRIGDKGLFTKEIEQEILAGRVDMAVHSMKDMPTLMPEGLAFGAIMARESPLDVLISWSGYGLAALSPGSVVGTSSLRRRSQIMQRRPDLVISELRGNVDTRIQRVRNHEMDAIVLASAGIRRLGYDKVVTEELDFLPAVGQGAIVIQTRSDDASILSLIKSLDDLNTRQAIEAERAFLAALEGGCQVPIGALAQIRGQDLVIEGMVSDLEGQEHFRDCVSGSPDLAEDLGCALAERLVQQGADQILDRIRCQGYI